MSRFYVRSEAGIRETVAALAVALGVGGLSFYLARMLLAREGLESTPPPRVEPKPGRIKRVVSGGGEGC